MKRYRLTPEAEKDLDQLSDYIANDNPPAALRLLDQIDERCIRLAEMPETGRSREELAKGLRSAVVGKYVIFYRSDDSGIQVIRVLHGSRDIPSLFE